MAWSFRKAVEKVTRWNAPEVNNLEEGVEEAKTAAAVAQSTAEGRPSQATVEKIASEAATRAESEAAQAVATTNIASLSGIPAAGSTDEVTLSAGQNVLLTAQATASQNGLWKVEAGAWKRPVSFAENSSQYGVFVPVVAGKVYSGSIWVLKNKTTVTVEKTEQEWEVNATGSGVVAAKELVGILGKQTTAAGEGAMEAFRLISFVEQAVHTSNTAVGWNALKNLTGLVGTFPPTATTAIGSSVITMTGVEGKAGGAYSGGTSNTPIVVFRKLTTGVTGVATGVAYYVVGGTANTFEVALTKSGAGVKVAGHALEAATTEVDFLASAEDNTCIGSQAGGSLTLGGGNTLLGENAGHNLTTGEENTAIGCEALGHEKTVIGNVAIGFLAAWGSEGSTPTLAIGNQALEQNVKGNWNIAIGNQTMREGSGQAFNLAVGHSNMKKATAGAEGNTAIGIQCMKSLTTGKFNVAVGETTGDKLSAGSKNTLLGTEAGAAITTTSGNVFVGNQAGKSLTGENELRIANNETTAWITGAESGKKLGFYNVTPVVRATTFSAVVTTTPALASYGFTQAQAEAIIANLNSVRTLLKNVGLME